MKRPYSLSCLFWETFSYVLMNLSSLLDDQFRCKDWLLVKSGSNNPWIDYWWVWTQLRKHGAMVRNYIYRLLSQPSSMLWSNITPGTEVHSFLSYVYVTPLAYWHTNNPHIKHLFQLLDVTKQDPGDEGSLEYLILEESVEILACIESVSNNSS